MLAPRQATQCPAVRSGFRRATTGVNRRLKACVSNRRWSRHVVVPVVSPSREPDRLAVADGCSRSSVGACHAFFGDSDVTAGRCCHQRTELPRKVIIFSSPLFDITANLLRPHNLNPDSTEASDTERRRHSFSAKVVPGGNVRTSSRRHPYLFWRGLRNTPFFLSA